MTDRPAPGSSGLGRRSFVLGSAMLAVSGVSWARMPRPNRPALSTERFNAMMPARLGDWRFITQSGLVLPPSDALSDRLYDTLVTRSYANGTGQVMMLMIAYNNQQDGVLQIHRPEICYPAGGFRITDTRAVDVPIGGGRGLPCNSFVATSDARVEQVLYWTRVGSAFPRTWGEQRWAVARENLNKVIPDGLLARISLVDTDRTASSAPERARAARCQPGQRGPARRFRARAGRRVGAARAQPPVRRRLTSGGLGHADMLTIVNGGLDQ